MKAKSIKARSASELGEVLQQSMADGFTPTLAVIFLSIVQDRTAIVSIMDKNNIQVFGVTSNGEFTDETPGKQSIAVLLLDINRANFTVLHGTYEDNNFKDKAYTLAKEAAELYQNPAFLIGGSHSHTDAEALLRGIAEATSPDVDIYGCMAGDDITFTEQYVFTNGWESNKGMVMLALDGNNMIIKGKATCGWKAVGTVKTVTKSEGNHVYTVDDIPVLDITAKYGGIENVHPGNENLLLEIAANLPLQLQREKGDPVMRPGLIIDWTDRSFYCSGTVPQGSKVRFSLPPDFDVVETVIKSAEDMKANEMPEADALVVFSCAGRLLSFGPMISQEIEGIKNVWNVPMAGMFSNAELGRATGGDLEMHNETTCIVALKEK